MELAIPFLEKPERRELILEGYKRLRKHLGDPGVTDRAAHEIFNLVKK